MSDKLLLPFGIRWKDRIDSEFARLSRREALEFAAWFHQERPNRIAAMEAVVQSTPGCCSWAADFSTESLGALGNWFASTVVTRNRTADEVAEQRRNTPGEFASLEVIPWTLDEATFARAFDVGIYLADILERNCLGLQWGLDLTAKRSIDFQQPVLKGFGKVAFNPIYMGAAAAFGIAWGSRDSTVLTRLYEIWSQKLGVHADQLRT